MNIKSLIHYLCTNTDRLIDLLEELEFTNINVRGTELRCAREEGHNSNSIKIDLKTMHYYDFSKNRGGDILNLIQNERSLDFKQALNKALSILSLDGSMTDSKEVKRLKANRTAKVVEVVPEAKVYTKEEFMQEFEFNEGTNTRFFKDGISKNTQHEFALMYDEMEGRIIIPWRNKDGGFVGWNGRDNAEIAVEGVPKYIIKKGFKKGNLLYGIYENSKFLENKKKVVYVFEAEKSVMKAYTAGIHNCVAIGSNNISNEQIELLKELNLKAVIIAFDEGLEEFEIQRQAQKLGNEGIVVGYLFDADNKYLKKGSKGSPMDLGGEEFKSFVRDENILK